MKDDKADIQLCSLKSAFAWTGIHKLEETQVEHKMSWWTRNTLCSLQLSVGWFSANPRIANLLLFSTVWFACLYSKRQNPATYRQDWWFDNNGKYLEKTWLHRRTDVFPFYKYMFYTSQLPGQSHWLLWRRPYACLIIFPLAERHHYRDFISNATQCVASLLESLEEAVTLPFGPLVHWALNACY